MTANVEARKLVTQPIISALTLDFSTVDISARIDIANTSNPDGTNWTNAGKIYEHVDFSVIGSSSQLTERISEPQVTIAADKLFDITGYPTTLSLSGYRGVRVTRYRIFDGDTTPILEQQYFVKRVEEFTATTITFTLTPTLGFDKMNMPSARKLEL